MRRPVSTKPRRVYLRVSVSFNQSTSVAPTDGAIVNDGSSAYSLTEPCLAGTSRWLASATTTRRVAVYQHLAKLTVPAGAADAPAEGEAK